MTTIELFGTATEPWSMNAAQAEFVRAGPVALKTFIMRYWAKTKAPDVGFALHEPGGKVRVYRAADLGVITCGEKTKWFRDVAGPEGKVPTKPKDIFAGLEPCICTVDTAQPRVYADEQKQVCINLFGGWLHKEAKVAPTKGEMKKIEHWLYHLQHVFANDNETMYQFLIRWFARIAQKGKNQTALLLKSAQGTGKSVIFELFAKYVFGNQACLIDDDSSIILGNFNSDLVGKALLILEEMPTESEGAYRAMSNKLKMLCTGTKMKIKQKYAHNMEARNGLSLALLTNRDHAIRLELSDRRWTVLDINDSKRRDAKYFEDMWFNNNEEELKAAGAVMWKYLQHVDLSGHKDLYPPDTGARAENMMPLAAKWIKSWYLERDIGISKQAYCTFYNSWIEWMANRPARKVNQPLSKREFSTQLQAIPILTTKLRINGTPTPAIAEISHANLVRMFDANGWIDHKLDNITMPVSGAAPPKPLTDMKRPAATAKPTSPTSTDVKRPAPAAIVKPTSPKSTDIKRPEPIAKPTSPTSIVKPAAGSSMDTKHTVPPAPKPATLYTPPPQKPVPTAKPAHAYQPRQGMAVMPKMKLGRYEYGLDDIYDH